MKLSDIINFKPVYPFDELENSASIDQTPFSSTCVNDTVLFLFSFLLIFLITPSTSVNSISFGSGLIIFIGNAYPRSLKFIYLVYLGSGSVSFPYSVC